MRFAFAACLLLASPAAAQIAERHSYDPVAPSNPFLGDSSLPGAASGREMRDVRGKIHDARESGLISGREARQLTREARTIERLAYAYGRDGLSQSERRELDSRTLALRGRVNGGP
ncbi:MAG TPA: hypothetical protein VK472_02720 [Allosphingosinicella sp.]|nr:hypothetical protein [Allosphingosinicella sp.]